MPKVSVIIPCHNSEKFLSTCLNSVCCQTLEDIEVLAIDDHSTDHTIDILKRYEKEFPKMMRVYSLEETTGVSAARNLGLEKADGEFIGFVDSDDLISINMYHDFYCLAKQTGVSIVTESCIPIKEEDYNNHYIHFTDYTKEKEYTNYLQDPEIYFRESPAVWDKIFSHDLIGNTKFLEGRIFEDSGFTYPLLLKAKVAYKIARGDYLYRQRVGSVTKELDDPTEKIFDMLAITEDMKKFAQENHFNEVQTKLLEDVIKERLLITVAHMNDWEIPKEKKEN